MNESEILSVITSKPSSFITLARKLRIDKNKNREFSKFLSKLVSENKIGKTKNSEYFKYKFLKISTGIFKATSKGFGIVELENSKDIIFFTSNSRNGALSGDKVKFNVFESLEDKFNGYGIVIQIIERANSEFIGSIIKNRKYYDFIPIKTNFGFRTKIINQNIAKSSHLVKAKLKKVINKTVVLEIIKDFGNINDSSTSIDAFIGYSKVPTTFSTTSLQEVKKIPLKILLDKNENRIDLREKLIITIDGDDSKDFDDAISIDILKNKNYLLKVHIADVSYYVKQGSSLDKDALDRGTSIYLINKVIPMLPFEISNGICSLNPNEDRFTITCEMEINLKGESVGYKIYPSIIRSKHRLTYNKVNKFYSNNNNFNNKSLKKLLLNAKDLSKIIRRKKESDGYVNFEITEPKFILDSNEKVSSIVEKKQDVAESMIEDFMVRANETVSKFIEDKNLPFIYRIHDKPTSSKLLMFNAVMKCLNLGSTLSNNVTSKQFAKFVLKIKKKRFDNFIKLLLLQTMAKACYSVENIGHFGLASTSYTHFTSPIRRYSDLIVHRMIREYTFKRNKNAAQKFNEILPNIASHISATELRAQNLERQINDIKKLEFYEKSIGKEKNGVIVSVQRFGMFIEFDDKVNGLLHISNLFDGHYELTNNLLQLKSMNRSFTIGDEIKVTIISVDKMSQQIDLVLSSDYGKYLKNKKHHLIKKI